MVKPSWRLRLLGYPDPEKWWVTIGCFMFWRSHFSYRTQVTRLAKTRGGFHKSWVQGVNGRKCNKLGARRKCMMPN
jgi:hypothetical protein